ncbi:hypothetical protein ACFYT4_02790 [Streptomyces sp. NPDC004609]|uniref:hypothetical protein n=1 Tax=Streptomyces sp. NPDC004609 TaxID=3364704 RepID=UPI003681E842
MLGVLITGGDTGAPGTALLIAAAPVGRGRLIDAGSVLSALAAVPPSALTGTPAATVVELADPLDPQTVLTRVRAAATAEGPLFLYLAGQVHLDRKQRLPHLALARTTPATMRYTALPWHWLVSELAVRRPGTTTVVVDLVAAADAWPRVVREGLGFGPAVRLYGRVVPPADRRETAAPEYLRSCASIWRSGARPDPAALHEQAAAQTETEGALLLTPAWVPPAAVPEPVAAGPGAAPVAVPGAPPPPGSVPVLGTVAGGIGLPDGYAPVPPRPGTVPTAPSQGGPPRPPVAPGPPAPPARLPAGDDPHPAILAAARAGRHREASAAAADWEQRESRAHGPGSLPAIHWLEVRADLARLAREPALSCALWMSAADARLTRRQATDDPDVEGAVDRAHHQWEQIPDPVGARELAPRLVALRRRVPGRQPGALRVLERRLESLHSAHPA